MSLQKKTRKLLRDPQAFFSDSSYYLFRMVGGQRADTRPPQSRTPDIKKSGKANDVWIDLWRAYRDRPLTGAQVTAGSPIVAIFPLGVPCIDSLRQQRLRNEGAEPLVLPVWMHCAAHKDMDDIEYMLARDLERLSNVVHSLVEWIIAHEATVLVIPYDSSVLVRSLIMRSRAAGLVILCDLPRYSPKTGTATFDATLAALPVADARHTAGAAKQVRALVNVGGNDTVRLLLLPARQLDRKDSLLRACASEQLENALSSSEPTDHLVVVLKRRKGGFMDQKVRARLKAKYRCTVLYYDSMDELEPLLQVAVCVRAPVGALSIDWESDTKVTTYALDGDVNYEGQRPPVFTNLATALDAPRLTPWSGAGCDERESVLARIVSGFGLDLVAVPDPITNHAVTNGRQKHLNALLNAKARCYGATSDAKLAEVFVQWGAEPSESKERPEKQRSLIGAPRLYLEDGFIRSLGLWTNLEEPTCSVVMDTRSVYYDATKPSLLETILTSEFMLSDDEVVRARRLIDSIVGNAVSKYNYSPTLDLDFTRPGKRSILIVDQKAGDMSIKYGAATSDSFRNMIDAALALGEDADIIIKQHPCAIDGDEREAHFTETSLGEIAQRDNIHLIGFDVNPYSLIAAVDEVWVVTSGMGFEALMAGKRVRCFGLPFYAGWGLTEDAVQCHRRSRSRSLEDIFYIFYVMLTRYVDPETGEPAPIERVIEYFASHVSGQRR